MRLLELVCVECGKRSGASADGWRVYLVARGDDGEGEEVAFFCPGCAAEQFGDTTPRNANGPGEA